MAASGEPKASMLVIFPGALGDFVCFLPALARLSEKTRVHLLAKSQYRELVSHRVCVDSLERREIALLFAETSQPDPALRRFLDPYAAIYSWMGSADENYRRNLRIASSADVRCYPFRPDASLIHISDYYLACIGAPPGGPTRSPVSPAAEAVRWAEGYWSGHGLNGEEVLAVAPGSGAKQKNWPVEGYKKVIEWWKQEQGRALVFTGPAEEESGLAEHFAGEPLRMHGDELGKAAALLARCSFYIGNDSGLTHLAAALGVGTLAIFGPTDSVQWAPRGDNVRLMSRDMACSPCNSCMMKLCAHRSCLNDLSPEKVISSLQTMSGFRCTRRARHLDKV